MQEAGGDGMTSEELIDGWFDYPLDRFAGRDGMGWLHPVHQVLVSAMSKHVENASIKEGADRDADARCAVAYSYALEASGLPCSAEACNELLIDALGEDQAQRAFASVRPSDVSEALQRGWRFSVEKCGSLQKFQDMVARWKSMIVKEYAGGSDSWDDFRRNRVLDVCCWQCKNAATLVKIKAFGGSSGFLFAFWCDLCACYAVPTRPFVSIKGTRIDPDLVKEIDSLRPDKACSVCGVVAQLERHNYARLNYLGKHAENWPAWVYFGGNADKWQPIDVCRPCHEQWRQKQAEE